MGALGERFVVSVAEPGAAFVQRGGMWRINDIDDDEARVNVTPIEDPSGEVPSWTGSEIPVPAHVAREVGEIRAVAAEQFERGALPDAVADDLRGRYPTDTHTLSAALEPVERQVRADHPIPTADRFVVEGQARTASS